MENYWEQSSRLSPLLHSGELFRFMCTSVNVRVRSCDGLPAWAHTFKIRTESDPTEPRTHYWIGMSRSPAPGTKMSDFIFSFRTAARESPVSVVSNFPFHFPFLLACSPLNLWNLPRLASPSTRSPPSFTADLDLHQIPFPSFVFISRAIIWPYSARTRTLLVIRQQKTTRGNYDSRPPGADVDKAELELSALKFRGRRELFTDSSRK